MDFFVLFWLVLSSAAARETDNRVEVVLPLGYPCDGFGAGVPVPGNETHCPVDVDCGHYETRRYRTLDGHCNNLANSTWGAAGSHFVRNVGRRKQSPFWPMYK